MGTMTKYQRRRNSGDGGSKSENQDRDAPAEGTNSVTDPAADEDKVESNLDKNELTIQPVKEKAKNTRNETHNKA